MSVHSFIDKETACQVEQLLDDARRASGAAPRRVQILESGPAFTRRRVTLMGGEELPFRRNPHLAKTWRVISGIGHADIAEAEVTLMPGAEVAIAPGDLHQIENRGPEPLVLEDVRQHVDPARSASE